MCTLGSADAAAQGGTCTFLRKYVVPLLSSWRRGIGPLRPYAVLFRRSLRNQGTGRARAAAAAGDSVAVMAHALAGGYHGPPELTAVRALTEWTLDAWMLALVVLLGGCYLAGVRHLRRRGSRGRGGGR